MCIAVFYTHETIKRKKKKKVSIDKETSFPWQTYLLSSVGGSTVPCIVGTETCLLVKWPVWPSPQGCGVFQGLSACLFLWLHCSVVRNLCATLIVQNTPPSIQKGLSEGHSLLCMLSHFTVSRVSSLVELFVQAVVRALISAILCH